MNAGEQPRPGFGGRTARPATRPALLVIDLSRAFTESGSPLACELEGVVEAVALLRGAARAGGAPVIYTTVAYTGPDDHRAAAVFLEKVPALRILDAGSRWAEIDPRLAPAPREPVLRKLYASAFFGTDLAARLSANEVDGLIVCGASTSGCVRATVVDAVQHGLRTLVPREAVGDRDPAAHAQALRDVDGRYGDVVDLETARQALIGSVHNR